MNHLKNCPLCDEKLHYLAKPYNSYSCRSTSCYLQREIYKFYYNLNEDKSKITTMWIMIVIDNELYDFDYNLDNEVGILSIIKRSHLGDYISEEISIEYDLPLNYLLDPNIVEITTNKIKNLLMLKTFQ
jgi:hypothetical protein